MGDYKPLFFALGLLFVLGVVLPISLNGFVEVGDYNNDSLVEPLVTFVSNGYTTPDPSWIPLNQSTNLNPFSLLGDNLHSYLVGYVSGFTFVPTWLLVPIIIFIIVSLLYTIIKLLPTT